MIEFITRPQVTRAIETIYPPVWKLALGIAKIEDAQEFCGRYLISTFTVKNWEEPLGKKIDIVDHANNVTYVGTFASGCEDAIYTCYCDTIQKL